MSIECLLIELDWVLMCKSTKIKVFKRNTHKIKTIKTITSKTIWLPNGPISITIILLLLIDQLVVVLG